MTEPRDARQLRAQVIREITVAPGWNKEDATALVDELILSLPYIDDKNALAQPEPARVAAPSDGPYTVRRVEDSAHDWWSVDDANGEGIALCGEEDARRIAALLNAAAPSDGLREAALAVVNAAEPDEGFEGWIDYLVPHQHIDALRAALAATDTTGDGLTDPHDRCAHERDAPGWCYTHDSQWPKVDAICVAARLADAALAATPTDD
jgi:hypothetical protein